MRFINVDDISFELTGCSVDYSKGDIITIRLLNGLRVEITAETGKGHMIKTDLNNKLYNAGTEFTLKQYVKSAKFI